MQKLMPHFFATADDLLPMFSLVEGKRSLKYTRTGNFDVPIASSYSTAVALPTLGERVAHPDAVACPAYLVTEREAEIQFREIALSSGGRKWAVDQLVNPDSTVFSHGGIYGDDVLLYGRVSTVSTSTLAASLQRTFESALKRSFERVQAFYVGSHAMKLLEQGYRLTSGANSSTEYDLRR